jgi:hypothetical protein
MKANRGFSSAGKCGGRKPIFSAVSVKMALMVAAGWAAAYAQAPSSVSVTPSGQAGLATTFIAAYSDPYGGGRSASPRY